MKKMIVAIDGLKYSTGAVAFAIQLVRDERAHLVGVFLDDFSRHNFGVVDLATHEGSFESYYRQLRHRDDEERRQATDIFELACKKAHIPYTVHHDKDIAQQELAKESLYADLLIIDKGQTFSRYEQPSPSPFIQDVLASARCPVLLVPEACRPVEKIVFLYDGSASAVFAFRMFHQLLPGFSNKEAVILSIQENGKKPDIAEKDLMKEFATLEYKKLHFMVLRGDAEFQITNYLSKQEEETLVVLGAYDRGRISRWAKTSMADVLLNNLQFPLFVAHTK